VQRGAVAATCRRSDRLPALASGRANLLSGVTTADDLDPLIEDARETEPGSFIPCTTAGYKPIGGWPQAVNCAQSHAQISL
jgi:hypothetical protein